MLETSFCFDFLCSKCLGLLSVIIPCLKWTTCSCLGILIAGVGGSWWFMYQSWNVNHPRYPQIGSIRFTFSFFASNSPRLPTSALQPLPRWKRRWRHQHLLLWPCWRNLWLNQLFRACRSDHVWRNKPNSFLSHESPNCPEIKMTRSD